MPDRQPDEAGSTSGVGAGGVGAGGVGAGGVGAGGVGAGGAVAGGATQALGVAGQSIDWRSPEVLTIRAESKIKAKVKAEPGALLRLWRRVKGVTYGWRMATVERAPPWMRRLLGPVAWYADMLVIDHGFFRLIYNNRHRLSHEAWRSAQPAPHHIRALRRRGVRTIINLRGERVCGSYWLEQATCERKGIKLINFQLKSRAAPTRAELRVVRDLLDRIEYPVLFHCKSGADRVGMMSALYRVFREGASPAEARNELALCYGHFRQADTGVLDRFFEKYLEDNKRQPMPFMEWVETVYDPDALKREFKASGWARRLVDGILKRE